MDDLLSLQIVTSLGKFIFWNKIHLSSYQIDSETHFLSKRKLLYYEELTLVGEKFLEWLIAFPQLHNNSKLSIRPSQALSSSVRESDMQPCL